MLQLDEKMKISNKYQKRVQEGQITHWEHYQDILKGPTQKSWTWTIFGGAKKKRSHFLENRNFGIFGCKNTQKSTFWVQNINFGAISGQIGRNLEKGIYELFATKNPPLNGHSSLKYLHFRKNPPETQNRTFSHFWQNTVLDP